MCYDDGFERYDFDDIVMDAQISVDSCGVTIHYLKDILFSSRSGSEKVGAKMASLSCFHQKRRDKRSFFIIHSFIILSHLACFLTGTTDSMFVVVTERATAFGQADFSYKHSRNVCPYSTEGSRAAPSAHSFQANIVTTRSLFMGWKLFLTCLTTSRNPSGETRPFGELKSHAV